MKQGPLKRGVALLLCFLLMLPIAVSAQSSTYMNNRQPGITDIITQGGNPKSIMIQVLNLTEYRMELTGSSDTLHDETDRSRHTAKSFMFAPLGLPQTIPAVTGDPQNAKPYTAMLAWDDGGTADNKYAVKNWLIYTLKDVDCSDPKACGTIVKEDVDVGIWITRSNPDKGLDAGTYYQLAKSILHEVFAIIGVALFPEVPPVFVNFLLSTVSMSKTTFNTLQETGDIGHKWYVASFPVPKVGTTCYYLYSNCYPSQAIADDAVEEDWGPADGGQTQSRIVVVTQLLRGHAPTKACNPQCSAYCTWGDLGSAPVLMVTVMTSEVWNAAVAAAIAKCSQTTPTPDYCPTQNAGATALGPPLGSKSSGMPDTSAVAGAGAMIYSILQEHGREGLLALVSVIRSLNPVQRQLLREMYQTWRAGKPFTPNEQALLYLIAVHLRNAVK